MISKELAKAVLSSEYKKAIYSDGEVLCCTINIHELAHKCKEWVTKNDYTITLEQTVYVNALVYTATIQGISYNIKTTKLSFSGTEPKAIFAACEWILQNRE